MPVLGSCKLFVQTQWLDMHCENCLDTVSEFTAVRIFTQCKVLGILIFFELAQSYAELMIALAMADITMFVECSPIEQPCQGSGLRPL